MVHLCSSKTHLHCAAVGRTGASASRTGCRRRPRIHGATGRADAGSLTAADRSPGDRGLGPPNQAEGERLGNDALQHHATTNSCAPGLRGGSGATPRTRSSRPSRPKLARRAGASGLTRVQRAVLLVLVASLTVSTEERARDAARLAAVEHQPLDRVQPLAAEFTGAAGMCFHGGESLPSSTQPSRRSASAHAVAAFRFWSICRWQTMTCPVVGFFMTTVVVTQPPRMSMRSARRIISPPREVQGVGSRFPRRQMPSVQHVHLRSPELRRPERRDQASPYFRRNITTLHWGRLM
jgi:hypothetical protein